MIEHILDKINEPVAKKYIVRNEEQINKAIEYIGFPMILRNGFALGGLGSCFVYNELDLKSNIIVDDITFVTEPFFGEGRISAAINAFTDAGGIHFTSAGNFGDNGFQGVFNPSSAVPVTNFIDSNLIEFMKQVF